MAQPETMIDRQVHLDQQIQVATNYNSAMKKLRATMNEGPFGSPAVLTPTEATTLYRMITEAAGMRDVCPVPRSARDLKLEVV